MSGSEDSEDLLKDIQETNISIKAHYLKWSKLSGEVEATY